MNGDTKLPAGLQEKIQQAAQEKQDAAQANAIPFPGALRDAFSPEQNIQVGQYTVRPFYELDFEVLQMVDHPLARMALGGDKFGEKLQDLRGRYAWVACWLLTHSLDEVDEVSQKGAESVLAASRREFGRKQLGDVLEVSKAVLEQFGRYFATVVGLVPAEEEEGKQSKKA
jgi:hypothetical protein